ncbi:MAG: hypothetical protein C0424_10355 [Sphingobacteriaceae bacterium]|nr:hypothetical protein [Sphingobacteriaceae bacterium]
MAKKAENQGAATAAPSIAEQLEKALSQAGAPAEEIKVLVDFVKTAETTQELLKKSDEALEAKEAECIDLHEKVETLEKEVSAARETLKELEQAIASAEQQATAKADEIVVGKETYLVDAGNYKFDGEIVNAENLKENPKLAQKLIELGVGFIKMKGA